jgi:prepilin-type N-terminal cleavage/methylation domain-containing protein
MRNSKGFTLIELIVVLGILGILTSIALSSSGLIHSPSPENAAIAFTSRNNYRFDSCINFDSDGDGYVTCQAFDQSNNPTSPSNANISGVMVATLVNPVNTINHPLHPLFTFTSLLFYTNHSISLVPWLPLCPLVFSWKTFPYLEPGTPKHKNVYH